MDPEVRNAIAWWYTEDEARREYEPPMQIALLDQYLEDLGFGRDGNGLPTRVGSGEESMLWWQKGWGLLLMIWAVVLLVDILKDGFDGSAWSDTFKLVMFTLLWVFLSRDLKASLASWKAFEKKVAELPSPPTRPEPLKTEVHPTVIRDTIRAWYEEEPLRLAMSGLDQARGMVESLRSEGFPDHVVRRWEERFYLTLIRPASRLGIGIFIGSIVLTLIGLRFPEQLESADVILSGAFGMIGGFLIRVLVGPCAPLRQLQRLQLDGAVPRSGESEEGTAA